ncbi:DoxX family protein [Arenibacter sp. 6A1]|uniref:DoxX family protein n=1 Tax=Arenibacter sp. 6A1 TaxID=2720391 RepID=UPI0014487E03|nr:DoxX family protein [Arenibacter sp. 6A1]NKI27908.1 DoxX family protein [Arenibacter sp. 6A1]
MEYLYNYATELLLLLFLFITFAQSAIDKTLDWKGNITWLKGHFSQTPVKNIVPALLAIVLVTEIFAGVLCILGFFQIAIQGENTLAFSGAVISCLTLLMLLFGQRLAKDYEGAKTIAVYFIPAIFLVFLLQ